jgi:hypothetical protein
MNKFTKSMLIVAMTCLLIMCSLGLWDMSHDLPRVEDHHILAMYMLIGAMGSLFIVGIKASVVKFKMTEIVCKFGHPPAVHDHLG